MNYLKRIQGIENVIEKLPQQFRCWYKFGNIMKLEYEKCFDYERWQDINNVNMIVTDDEGITSFAEGDRIGLFVPGTTYAGEWKYDGTNWSTDNEVTWENREDEFEFCAFYPFTSGEISADNIPVPDLATQSGKLSDVGAKDFLVGRCITSYSDNDGVVSFTGSSSFEHVFSLIHISIVSQNNDEVSVTGCKFEGDGIVEKKKYVFGGSADEDELVGIGSSGGSVLEIDYQTSVSVSEGLDIVVLINPVSLDSSLKFSLFYEKDETEYVADIELPGEYRKGNYNKIRLSWVKDGLVMQGNDIKDWNVVDLELIELLEGNAV